ncbi:hypothetical protein [Pseudoalteromonas sp. GB56]
MKSKISLVTSATLLALGLGSSVAHANSLQPNFDAHGAKEVKANGAAKERVIVKFTRGNSASVKALAKKLGGEIKVDSC